MRTIILLIFLSLSLLAENYTFLVKPYDKEIELEAKIVAQIASSSLNEKIKLFIPNISTMEKKVYSKYFTLAQKCETSNFVFVNKVVNKDALCDETKRLFITNNYRKLLSDDTYYGAFFWNKSRPNIVFIKRRLEKRAIQLPATYDQFIENF